MPETSDPRLYHAHVPRNREAILAVLKRLLPARALVLEIASGSGEHAAFFAKSLPSVSWLPTDIEAKALASIAAFRAEAKCPICWRRCASTSRRNPGRSSVSMRWSATT